MFGLHKQTFIGLLASIVNASNHIECISLKSQQCTILPTLINLHPYEYVQRLLYCSFAVNLGKCMGSCDTLNNLRNTLCVLDKTENLNLNVLKMITRIKEAKTLT